MTIPFKTVPFITRPCPGFLLSSLLVPIVTGLVGLCALFLVISLIVWYFRVRPRETEFEKARRLLDQQMQTLRTRFFQMASTSGKPRGLVWTRTDWKRDIAFARDLETGLLTAFVGIEIAFAAIPGSDMEEVAAVGQIRQASALFHFRDGRWGTGGKALFNLTPPEAIERLAGQFEPVTQG